MALEMTDDKLLVGKFAQENLSDIACTKTRFHGNGFSTECTDIFSGLRSQ